MGRKKSKKQVGPHVKNPPKPSTINGFVFYFTALRNEVTNNKMVKCAVLKVRNNCDDFELAQNVGCKYDIAFKDCFRNR